MTVDTPGKSSIVIILPHLLTNVCLILHRYPQPRPDKRRGWIRCYCITAAYHTALIGIA